MKIRDLINCCTSELWITFDEDPNGIDAQVNIIVEENARTGIREDEMLSDFVLDSDVHLMCSPKQDVVFVSIFEAEK